MAPKRPVFQSKLNSVFIILVVSALLLSSCGLPAIGPSGSSVFAPTTTTLPRPATATLIPPSPTPQPTETPTVSVPTDTPQPTAIPASPTPENTATPMAPTGTIVFAPGASAAVVQDTVQPAQVITYTVGALESQPLVLIVNSKLNDITLGVFDPNQKVLLDPAVRNTAWQGVVPATGLYTIQVRGGTQAESYTLTAKTPQVVNFEPGASSATLAGTTVNGYLYSYALACSAGQTMNASLDVPATTATLDVYGVSGGTFLSASMQANSWSGTLPQTQDYVIEVIPVNGQVVNYNLTVSVTSGTAPTSYNVGTIAFAPGMTAATVLGTVLPGQEVSYTVAGNYAQPLILLLESPKRDATLGIYEADGSTLVSPAMKWSEWQGQLPKTDVYTIKVIGGVNTDAYTLTVKLPQLAIRPASNVVTLYGSTQKGMLVSYYFRCSAGSHMTVKLNTPATTAYLDVFGVASGVLLSYSALATKWSGDLPQTEDYVIEVIPRGGQWVSYSLTVSFP